MPDAHETNPVVHMSAALMSSDAAQLAEKTALVQSIADGTAADADAAKTTLAFISALMSAVTKCSQSMIHASRPEQIKSLDEVDKIRNDAWLFTSVLEKHYHRYVLSIKDALHVSLYACATLTPCAVLGQDSPQAEIEKTYIVKNESNGLIKIGKANNPYERIKSLETGSGCALTVCKIIPINIERELHKRFAHLRVFREWFRDDGSIAEFVLQGGAA